VFARRNARAVHDGFYSRAVAPRRNYADVADAIREFMRRGVIIKTVINGMTFDGATKDAMQMAVRDALIAFMAATAHAPGRGHQGSPAGWYRTREDQWRELPWAQAKLQPRAARHGPGHAGPERQYRRDR